MRADPKKKRRSGGVPKMLGAIQQVGRTVVQEGEQQGDLEEGVADDVQPHAVRNQGRPLRLRLAAEQLRSEAGWKAECSIGDSTQRPTPPLSPRAKLDGGVRTRVGVRVGLTPPWPQKKTPRALAFPDPTPLGCQKKRFSSPPWWGENMSGGRARGRLIQLKRPPHRALLGPPDPKEA